MISDIRLQHFRSYSDETFEFTPAVNIIVGANGSGKTNLLEAILVIARGTSYRAKDHELIQHDQPWARLDGHINGGSDTNDSSDTSLRTLKIVQDELSSKAHKTYEIEGRSYRRLVPSKTLPVVIFEPNHLYMLTGSPELRRSYLDDLLEQIDPSYGRTRRDYRRVLAQRNALLKRLGMQAASQIFPWNVRLSELGGSLTQARLALLADLNQAASQLYSSLAHKDTAVELRYETTLPLDNYASSLLRALETGFERDVMRGFTGAGPHREDISVLLRGRLSQATASRGEARTAVLMLKVMELRFIEQARAVRPLLLLDDVFSELDGARRQALTAYLQDYQTFITTTDVDIVVGHFMDSSTIIPIGSTQIG
jgi:DNA replication and repair protein RecF